MSRVIAKIGEELRAILPATIYSFVMLNIVAPIRVLILKGAALLVTTPRLRRGTPASEAISVQPAESPKGVAMVHFEALGRRVNLVAGLAVLVLFALHSGEAGAQRERRGGEGEVDRRYEEPVERDRPVDDGAYRGDQRRDEDDTGNGPWQQGGDEGEAARRDDAVDADANRPADTNLRDTRATGAEDVRDRDAARDAAVDDRGAAGAAAVRDGDAAAVNGARPIGEQAIPNLADCEHGDCARTTLTTLPAAVGVAPGANFIPYNSYPCPGGAEMMPSVSGDIVYRCAVTPVVTATVPLTGSIDGAAAPATAQVTSSPVIAYDMSSGVVVYSTSYAPTGVFSSQANGRYYWIPGAATGTPEVEDNIEAATEMAQPSANATVVTYTVNGERTYLTSQPPIAGIYNQPADRLYAWMPGVKDPTQAERDIVGSVVAAHRDNGARALHDEVSRAAAVR